MGHVRFVVFYLLCGVAAALTQALIVLFAVLFLDRSDRFVK